MKFENIGGNSREAIYSLYDYSNNPYGETIFSIEFNLQTKRWWFLECTNVVLTKEHMIALQELLHKLLN